MSKELSHKRRVHTYIHPTIKLIYLQKYIHIFIHLYINTLKHTYSLIHIYFNFIFILLTYTYY